MVRKKALYSRKSIYIVVILILLSYFIYPPFSVLKNSAEAATIYVDDTGGANFTSIQAAIDAASDGDTIFVYEGIYHENIVITKNITLKGDSKKAVVDGGYGGDVITIMGASVSISGFTIINSGDGDYGIKIYASNDCIIRACNISNNYGGIGIFWSDNNIIGRNVFTDNTYAIFSTSGKYNRIEENIFSSNINAIRLSGGSYTSGNIIRYNNFMGNSVDGVDDGISNYWDYEHVGNYWDKYAGNDADGDGIGDIAYTIYGDVKDHYPLMEPYAGIDIFPPDIMDLHASPQIQIPGSAINISGRIIDNVEVNEAYINITLPGGGYINSSLTNINGTDTYYYVNTFYVKGVYHYYVWANDTNNNSDSSGINIFVIAYKPTANFTYTPDQPTELDEITFDASSSSDPDGSIVNYTWNLGDGSVGYGVVVQHKYSFDGVYNVTLTVWDNDGAWDVMEKNVVVINLPPVANFSFTPTQPIVGEVVTFNDSSYDLDGSVRIWRWDFGDGIVIEGSTSDYRIVNHSYTKDGIYNVTLTVWDNDYANSSLTKQISVMDIYPPAISNITAFPNPQEINEYVNISCDINDDVEVAKARVNVTYPDGHSINSTMIKAGNGKYFYNLLGDWEGDYTYFIWAKDTSNNTNKSNSKNFTVITPPEPPHIENVSIIPEIQQYGMPVNISCYVYDNVGVEDVILIFPDINISMNGTVDAKGNGWYYYNSTFGMGTHEFYIRAIDINGFTNNSSNYSFTVVDTVPPTIENVTCPIPSPPSVVNISCIVRDNQGVKSVFINISGENFSLNRSMNSSGSMFYSNIALNEGDYLFYIWAEDLSNNSVASGTFNLTVTIFPVANFSFSPENPTDLDNITFMDASYDMDGIITNYTWDFGDGSMAYEQNPVHRYAEDGSYNVTLVVKDDDGAEGVKSIVINIANAPPVADFSVHPSPPNDMDFVYFNASLSHDDDGVIVNYTWEFGDGWGAYGVNVSHRFIDNGFYNVTLSIKDNDGASSSITKQIYVENVPPVANFSYSPSTPHANDTIYFTSTSYDKDGVIVNYTWNFGDGNISYETNPTHSYQKEGIYIINLTVSDNDNGVNTIEKSIVVGGFAPVANFTWQPLNPHSGEEIYFLDLSSSPSSWHWDFGDGSHSTQQNPVHVYSLGNLYNVTLTIFNGSMNSSISKVVEVDTYIKIVKNENNVVNYIPWLGNETTASQLASMIGNDIMPTGSVVSKWNTSRGAFDSYVVGVSPPSYDFVISPGDCVVLRVANGGQFVIEVIK